MSPKGRRRLAIALLTMVGPDGASFAEPRNGSSGEEGSRRRICAVRIATGSGFSCALTAAGGVECWGFGFSGQLGDGASGPGAQSDTPRPVVSLGSGVAQIATGFSHACAVKRDGSLWCWGSGSSGELGDGQQGAEHLSAVPIQVAALGHDAVQVSAGNSFTCATRKDRTAWCWGENLQGQIGRGSLSTGPLSGVPEPSQVAGMTAVIEVAAGGFHACARLAGGGVWCWGNDQLGELGDGVTGTFNPTPVQAQDLAEVTALDAGQEHTCAVQSDGSLWCWGNNPGGELGIGQTGGFRAVPTKVALPEVRAIDAGFQHTCAIAGPERGLWCWGALQTSVLHNALGAFQVMSNVPLKMGGDLEARVSRSSVGKAHTCAVRDDGLQCWGANQFGELGLGDLQDRFAPIEVRAMCRSRELSGMK